MPKEKGPLQNDEQDLQHQQINNQLLQNLQNNILNLSQHEDGEENAPGEVESLDGLANPEEEALEEELLQIKQPPRRRTTLHVDDELQQHLQTPMKLQGINRLEGEGLQNERTNWVTFTSTHNEPKTLLS